MANGDGDAYVTLESQISDEERFKDCERLELRCRHCKTNTTFDGIGRVTNDDVIEYGLSCAQCHETLSIPSIRVQLTLAIRSCIRRYYEGWLICDDPTCSNRTRMMSVFGRRCVTHGCQGAMNREVRTKKEQHGK